MNAEREHLVDSQRPAWLSPASALGIVGCVAAVVQLWLAGSTGLVVTNDSIDYLGSTISMLNGGKLEIAEFRTPGYPALLLACFRVFGMGAFGVLLVQHAMAACTAVLVTRISLRYAPPLLAALVGLLCALDPVIGLFASIMLTESPSIFLFVLCAALALHADRRPLLTAIALGASLAILILVRPAFQATVPFLLLGAALHRPFRWRRAGAVACTGAASLMLCLWPWLSFNRERGLTGVAQGLGPALWVSMVQQDLLIHDYPLPPDVERRFEGLKEFSGATPEMWAFVGMPADSPEQTARMPDLCKQWAIESVRRDPMAYLSRLPYSLAWQLNYFPQDGFIKNSQIKWLNWLATRDVDEVGANPINISVDANANLAKPLEMSGRGGPARRILRWWNLNCPEGFPQIPLAYLAFCAGLIALVKREYPLALVLLASASLVGVHVAMLFHQGRYSLPAVALWYAVVPVMPLWIWRLIAGTPAVPKPA